MAAAAESQMRNAYLEQVVQEKAQLEEDLRVRKRKLAPAEPRRFGFAPERESSGQSLGVRITGFWRWKNVIVPPNCHVVHTRRGKSTPLHLGLGVSFRYNPVTDAFLVVPATMQTIIIHANCICGERQGVVVQGYVQWIIDDFATAYRKLDLTDPEEPMRVVDVQLREQAEAAIKDKVATMSIDEVLADKQPIIEELTARLRHVAEGEGDGEGLGLRIVTVQIKEAIVSSPRVWESLQRPFRAERSKEARLAELGAEATVRAREIEAQKKKDAMEIQAASAKAALEAEAEAECFARTQEGRIQKARLEAEAIEQTLEHERRKVAIEGELERLRLEGDVAAEGLRAEAERIRQEQELALVRARRVIDNDRSEAAVKMALIEALPELAQSLPKPEELKSITIGGDPVATLASSLGGLMKAVKEA